MATGVTTAETARTRVRFTIVAMLFAVTMINYADRATISIAGPALSKDLGLTPVQMGFIFSAFGWSYVLCQIPGGWLLDRFGSKIVYFWSIFLWSLFTLLQGGVGILAAATAVCGPVHPALPGRPGGVAVVPGQRPHRGGLVPGQRARHRLGHLQLGAVLRDRAVRAHHGLDHGLVRLAVRVLLHGPASASWSAFIWLKVVYSPKEHPRLSPAELDYIEKGGALVHMDQPKENGTSPAPNSSSTTSSAAACRTMNDRAEDQATTPVQWDYLKQLLTNRMLLGIYIGAVLHQRADLFLHHLVPSLPGPAARHVDPERGHRRLDSSHLRLRRRRAGRRHFRLHAAQGLVR